MHVPFSCTRMNWLYAYYIIVHIINFVRVPYSCTRNKFCTIAIWTIHCLKLWYMYIKQREMYVTQKTFLHVKKLLHVLFQGLWCQHSWTNSFCWHARVEFLMNLWNIWCVVWEVIVALVCHRDLSNTLGAYDIGDD